MSGTGSRLAPRTTRTPADGPSGAWPNERDELELYKLYREHIAAEATWSAHRTTWLITANAFLATALAIMSDKRPADLEDGAEVMRSLLPTAAIAINFGTLAMLLAAEWVIWRRLREYPDTGSGLPRLIGSKGAHVVGFAVPALLALALAVGWCFIATA